MTFLRLEDYLAPLPLPAIIAVLMTLGLKYLGGGLMRRLKSGAPEALQGAAGFIVAAALAAAAVHLLALAGLAYTWVLRVLAWSLVALGLTELFRLNREWFSSKYSRVRGFFQEQSLAGQAAILLLAFTVAGLALAALGPATDADSLDYHLGVPLEILRHHGALPRPDWLCARLIGLGESLNLLGLAGGTDIFGAALQFAALLAVLAALGSLGQSGTDKLFTAMCVVGCPVIAFLVPNQKPQMLPIAATTVALVLLVSRWHSLHWETLILVFLLTFFAISCKYSFLLSGGIILALGMVAAYRTGMLAPALGIALAAYLILGFPVHLQNLIFYGDPISPFLERFKPDGDPTAIRFATYVRSYLDPRQGSLRLPFPVNIIFPTSLGGVTTILGLGALLPLLIIRKITAPGPSRIFLVSALLAAALTLLLGQHSARFFFEPYLWFMAAGAASGWRLEETLLFRAMLGQMLLMALIATFGAITLFPGSLCSGLRHRVMLKAAYGYSETCWLNEVLPREAVILETIRVNALMPRPALSTDMFFHNLDDPWEKKKFETLLNNYGVDTIIVDLPLSETNQRTLTPYLGVILAGPKAFTRAYRNPWNRGDTSKIIAFRLKNDQGGDGGMGRQPQERETYAGGR